MDDRLISWVHTPADRTAWQIAKERIEAKQCDHVVAKCQACGGQLIDIRAKLQCKDCGRINESCCEGSRG